MPKLLEDQELPDNLGPGGMIPADTDLTDEQFKVLMEISIPIRVEELKECRYGDISKSLWIMGELEHIHKLRKHNEEIRACQSSSHACSTVTNEQRRHPCD